MNNNKSSSFFKGLLFGALAGAVAGILFAPKSGVETRKDIKNLTTEAGNKCKNLYLEAKKKLLLKVKSLKDAGINIDKTKYEELVNEALAEIKNDFTVTNDVTKKIGIQLKQDWEEVKAALKA